MNNFFSFKRFSLLLIKHSAEHYRTYLMSIGVLAGVMVLGGSFIFYMIPGPMDAGFQTALYAVLMLIAGCIFASTVFADMGDKRKAIPALSLPASTFEKYLVGWLYSYLVFIVVFTAVFYVVLLSLISLKHWPGHNNEVFSIFQDRFSIVFIIFSLLHSISMYGAVVFEKLHFIKIGFAFFISYALLIICNTFFIKSITGLAITPAIPFGLLNFSERGTYYNIAPGYEQSLWVFAVMAVVVLLFWIATYFRLKEKQV
ncbi:hypothetical protein ACFFGT_11975 [Mucilaginibacter angelicae]|uniref:ABC transporter permease n=1 Tax=Mucilaginibacter angelicae TaxID=869718 RepID=A0ABV6L624_9SPHI